MTEIKSSSLRAAASRRARASLSNSLFNFLRSGASLAKRQQAEERKKRTHRLIEVGAAVESVLDAPIEEDDLPRLIAFLKKQEANGKFFTKAMQKSPDTDME